MPTGMVPMMWVGTVRALSFTDQLAAAREGGFTEMSVTPLQCQQLWATGTSAAEMLLRSRDEGVTITHLDPVTRWSRSWVPQNMPPATHPFFAYDTDTFLRMAAELEVSSISAISTGRQGSVSVAELTDEFGALCERARQHGIRCDLEFIPLSWGIPDPGTAWQIIDGAAADNAGLVLDFWHFFRSGADWAALDEIPGDRISHVQLCDAAAAIPAGRVPVDDCLQERVPPGTGDLDVTRLLTVLHSKGALHRVGPEIFSAALDTLPAHQIAAICRGSPIDALNRAGVDHPLGPPDPDWTALYAAAVGQRGLVGNPDVPRSHP